MEVSIEVRNARLDVDEVTIGTTPILRIFTGSAPATTALADSGTELVEMNLPSDWMGAASAGVKALAGVWSGVAGATGTPGYFRIYNSGDTTCHMQGTVGAGLELVPDSGSETITTSQTVTISAFNITANDA